MKLAVLGAGKIVQEFLPLVEKIEGLEALSIYSTKRSLDKNKQLANTYHIPNVSTEVEELLADPEVDTVYVALPNHLHYEFVKKALEADKHVICEKPFTLRKEQLDELAGLAESKQLILIEAITTVDLPNFKAIKDYMDKIGPVRLINCNFVQYSSRYDAFLEGDIAPVFNPKMGGGALVDLNIYNIHFVLALLGEPEKIQYLPNMNRGVDTSGLLTLSYEDAQVNCIGAKDSHGLKQILIQGEKGVIIIEDGTNSLESAKVIIDDQVEQINYNENKHRMIPEFEAFIQIIREHDLEEAKKRMTHSKMVMAVLDKAIKDGELHI